METAKTPEGNPFTPEADSENGVEGNVRFIAGEMILRLAQGIPGHADQGKPSAAVFQSGVQALDPSFGELVGSGARHIWIDRMKSLEEGQLGPVREWLSKLMGGKDDHPVLRRSIEWLEEHGDETCTSAQMLLADLYAEVGQMDKAQETYSAALKRLSESGSGVTVME